MPEPASAATASNRPPAVPYRTPLSGACSRRVRARATHQPHTGDATHQPTRAVRAAVTGPPTRNHLETHMAEHTNVVITGLGTTNPLGGDVTSTWAGAVAGRSGVSTLEYDWVSQYELPVTFAGQLATPVEDVLEKREMRRMDPSAQFAVIAARQAWADAGAPEVDGERLGTVVASGIGGVTTLVNAWDTIKEKGVRRVLPLTVPMLMPNSPSAYVSLEVGAQAGAHTPVAACASGAEAVGYALDMIRSGRADMVLAGGTEAAKHPLPIASFAKMQALSTRNDDPQGASRPYDVNRDGFVLGEGAAVVVLESEEHRSEERRVGKECRSRGEEEQEEKKREQTTVEHAATE